jgi:hypothetical protein
MGWKHTARLLDAVGTFYLAIAVGSVLLLRGDAERIGTSVAGTVLIICNSASQRLSRKGDDALLKSKEPGESNLLRARDAVELAGIGIFGLLSAWLIYFAHDTLPHRRPYLVASLLAVGLSIFVARAIDRLAKKKTYPPLQPEVIETDSSAGEAVANFGYSLGKAVRRWRRQ